MALPLGQGRFVVMGVQTTARDDNTGLHPSQQAVSDEVAVYLTDNEHEAQTLVEAGGFESDGVFFATTRYGNMGDKPRESALRRDDPHLR